VADILQLGMTIIGRNHILRRILFLTKNPNINKPTRVMKTRTYNLGTFGIVRTPKDIKKTAKEIEKRALELMNSKKSYEKK